MGSVTSRTAIDTVVEIDKEVYLYGRDDGSTPAHSSSDGSREWIRKNGRNSVFHRTGDMPAFISSTGRREWRIDGKKHREADKPAVVYMDGTMEWYKDGKKNRDGDKPAEVRADGTLMWYKNGKVHREAGPAIIYRDDSKEWNKWWNEHLLYEPIVGVWSLEKKPGDAKGYRKWYVYGKLHRVGDKPAVEYVNGDEEYWVDGNRHRENYHLPSVITGKEGDSVFIREWWRKGKRHREAGQNINNGPAIIKTTRTTTEVGITVVVTTKEWWVNGKKHCDAGAIEQEPVVIVLKEVFSEDEKTFVSEKISCEFTKEWWVNDKKHRSGDQPAVIVYDVSNDTVVRKEWWRHGVKHRMSKPAVIIHSSKEKDVVEEYWMNGFKVNM